MPDRPIRRIHEEIKTTVTQPSKPSKRNFTDEDIQNIASAILPALAGKRSPIPPPPKPLHEMSEWERTAYANETWAAAGVIRSIGESR